MNVIIPVGAGLIISAAGYLYKKQRIKSWMNERRIDQLPGQKENTCGVCGSKMVQRRAPSGPHKGKLVMVCSRWPECRKVEWETVDISAGKAPRKEFYKEYKKTKPTAAGFLLTTGLIVLIGGIVWVTIQQAEFDAVKFVFKDISNVKDTYFIPMAKAPEEVKQITQTNPAIQEPTVTQQQATTNNADELQTKYYQYTDKDGIASFTDNKDRIPKGAKNIKAVATSSGLKEIQKTPITIIADSIYVPVRIRSQGETRELKLLLDTGATNTVIYLSSVPGLRVKNIGQSNAVLADGRVSKQITGIIDEISVGPKTLNGVEMRFMQLAGPKNHDGLLGMNFLKHFRYQLDLQNQLINWM